MLASGGPWPEPVKRHSSGLWLLSARSPPLPDGDKSPEAVVRRSGIPFAHLGDRGRGQTLDQAVFHVVQHTRDAAMEGVFEGA